jgi:hypothetical protein
LWIAADAGNGAAGLLRMAPMWQFGDDQMGPVFADAALSYDDAPTPASRISTI